MAETFTRWDPVNYLHTKEAVRGYLEAAVDEDCGDGRLIRAVLNNIARALDMNRLNHEFEITGEELRKALSADDNLSFAAVCRITRALGLKLKAAPAEDRPEEEICFRTISRKEAQAEIVGLLAASGKNLCYDDISERLRLDLEMVVEICQELEDKGAIGIDAL